MIRNIDILIEIQNRIHKFRILDDVIAVMLEDKDTEFSELIESPCQEMCDILNAINDIDKLLDSLTEDLRGSMVNDGFDPDDYKFWKCDANIKLAKMKNRSEFIEAAVDFYNGYLHGQNNQQFIGETLMNTFQSTMNNFERRMSRQMFKQAVETSKLFWLMVRRLNINPEDVDDLHYECVDEVKRINGAINFPYKTKEADE